MTRTAASAQDSGLDRSWRIHGGAVALLLLFILVQFRDAVVAAVQVWWIYPTYSHCFLVIPISLWLIWEKRDILRKMRPATDARALWVAPVLVLIWWMGELSTINEARQFAVVGLFEVAILAVLGARIFRAIWFPALYLVFLVPTGEYLIGPMQTFATHFTDVSLNLINIPHYTEGTTIELTNGRFEIAEACAGLRFFIATVALGVLFAYLMFRKWYKIVVFLFACLTVPLIANGLRCVGIILLAHFTDNKYGTGEDHLFYGWVFNVAILLGLFLLASLFRDSERPSENESIIEPKADSLLRIASVVAAAILLMSLGSVLVYWQQGRASASELPRLTGPLHATGWREGVSSGLWQPVYYGTDASLTESLTPEGQGYASSVDLYVGFYSQPRVDHQLMAKVNQLWNAQIYSLLSSRMAQAWLAGRTIQLQERIVTSPDGRRIIWACYWTDGEFTTSPVMVKLLRIPAALRHNRGEAVVALSTAVDGTDDDARRRLSDAFASLGSLPQHLDAASGSANSSGPSN